MKLADTKLTLKHEQLSRLSARTAALACTCILLTACSDSGVTASTTASVNQQSEPAITRVAASESNESNVTSSKAAAGSNLPEIVVYKSPTCGCCTKWVEHLQSSGFSVKTEDRDDMQPIKQQLGIPDTLYSCHTARVGNYVIEGHVPAGDIVKLLKDQPDVAGLAVPNMPKGSPGMEHPQPEDFTTTAFSAEGEQRVFAKHSASGGVSYSDDF